MENKNFAIYSRGRSNFAANETKKPKVLRLKGDLRRGPSAISDAAASEYTNRFNCTENFWPPRHARNAH